MTCKVVGHHIMEVFFHVSPSLFLSTQLLANNKANNNFNLQFVSPSVCYSPQVVISTVKITVCEYFGCRIKE